MSSDEAGSLLVTIIDTNPCSKLIRTGEGTISKCLDAITVFCNSHLMLSPRNKLAVIGCHSHKSCFLYPKAQQETTETYSVDGQHELFTEVASAVKTGVKDLVHSDTEHSVNAESLLAGGLSLALCYVNRIEKEAVDQKKLLSRILVFTGSGDSASQYLNFMNIFFTAQVKNVVIDACVLEKDSGLLQQGCDITGGKYLKVPSVAATLQYLLWVFLPDKESRNCLVLPPPVHVDYRAACFCHRNLIEIGYVCSVCLSIFCTFSPICSTCQTAFKFTGPIPPLLKAKKKKQKLGL
ncbi:general transcription factor IIH subunit 3-like [Ornithodoros turicata]|uniref:general transcription factor IIH subunit 3-like n=1 Tax=Ornithodoros turicata TaxID=34597 RepID=UPI003138C078